MILRDFEPRDLDAVVRLDVEALNPYGDTIARPATHHPDLEDIAGVYQALGCFLVGEIDGAVIAMGGLLPDDDGRFKMRRVRIDAGHQRKGLGRQLVEELERRALALGVRSIWLDTTVQQEAAQRLYEAMGYAETGRGPRQIGEVTYDLVYYEKHLV